MLDSSSPRGYSITRGFVTRNAESLHHVFSTDYLLLTTDYADGFRVILLSFASKKVITNGYTLPSSNFARRSASLANSEMWTSPATPSSIEASAPCLLYLMTTALTFWSFLYFAL